MYAVLKANAYGHGAPPVARRLRDEGAERFAVSSTEEGVALRRAGITNEILLLSAVDPSEVPAQRGYGLIPALHDADQVRRFAEAAAGLSSPLAVQLKIDTGMGRLGIRPDELPAVASLLRDSRGLEVSGAFTHFASAEETGSGVTAAQLDTFRRALEALRNAGLPPRVAHAANSAAVLAHPESHFDATRPGIALYGVSPSRSLPDAGLEPALELETTILSVRSLPAGTPIGYGGRFVTRRESRIAALPIGYHDGFRRSFSGRVSVLLEGGAAPVVGAVSMDLTTIDVTETGARTGERVVLLGELGGRRVTACDLADAADTIPYEILCGIGARVLRQYR